MFYIYIIKYLEIRVTSTGESFLALNPITLIISLTPLFMTKLTSFFLKWTSLTKFL